VAQGKPGAAGWDVESGKRFYHFPTDLTDGPLAVAFSTDSQAIAVGYQKRVDVWTGGRNPAKELGVGPVTALAFSPDGKFVAAGIRLPIRPGGDGKDGLPGFHTQVRLIDVATDKVVKVFDGFEGVNPMAATRLPVTALAFSPDGKKLLAGTGFPPITPLPDDLPKAGEFKLFDTWPEALIEKNSRSPSGRRSR
jgi:WD40 repeat protein